MSFSKKNILLVTALLGLVVLGMQACSSDPPVVVSKGLVTTIGPTYTPTFTFTPCSGVFGTNAIEPTTIASSGFVWFNPYAPAGNKTLLSISVYTTSTSPVTYELGVYNDNGTGGQPATLLGETGPLTIGPATMWSTAPLQSTVNLSSGVTYWLAVHATTSNYLSGGVSYAFQTVPATYGSLPATFSGTGPGGPFTFSLYGTTCP